MDTGMNRSMTHNYCRFSEQHLSQSLAIPWSRVITDCGKRSLTMYAEPVLDQTGRHWSAVTTCAEPVLDQTGRHWSAVTTFPEPVFDHTGRQRGGSTVWSVATTLCISVVHLWPLRADWWGHDPRVGVLHVYWSPPAQRVITVATCLLG